MRVEIVQGLEGAQKAIGLTVIIDVFRAFSLEVFCMSQNAGKIYPVADLNLAYNIQKKHPDWIYIGERNGIPLSGFDYGNSPFQINEIDFKGNTIVHTTSAGTQGIMAAKNASEIITGALVNAKAVANYIKRKNPEDVTLVAMGLGLAGGKPTEEDTLCAEYIKSLLEGKERIITTEDIEVLKNTSGKKFFDENQKCFPLEDFYLCTKLNCFDFILKVKQENNMYFIEKG